MGNLPFILISAFSIMILNMVLAEKSSDEIYRKRNLLATNKGKAPQMIRGGNNCDAQGCKMFCSRASLMGRCATDDIGMFCSCDYPRPGYSAQKKGSASSSKHAPQQQVIVSQQNGCDDLSCDMFCRRNYASGRCTMDSFRMTCECDNTYPITNPLQIPIQYPVQYPLQPLRAPQAADESREDSCNMKECEETCKAEVGKRPHCGEKEGKPECLCVSGIILDLPLDKQEENKGKCDLSECEEKCKKPYETPQCIEFDGEVKCYCVLTLIVEPPMKGAGSAPQKQKAPQQMVIAQQNGCNEQGCIMFCSRSNLNGICTMDSFGMVCRCDFSTSVVDPVQIPVQIPVQYPMMSKGQKSSAKAASASKKKQNR